jgi:hypothetical protein
LVDLQRTRCASKTDYKFITERKYDQYSKGDLKVTGIRKRNDEQIKKSKFRRMIWAIHPSWPLQLLRCCCRFLLLLLLLPLL